METSVLNLPEQEYLLSGNRTCAGCSLAISLRYIVKALDGKAHSCRSSELPDGIGRYVSNLVG